MIPMSYYESSPQISLPGNTTVVIDGNEFQDTVPFDDTVVLESPSSGSQLENLHADTEALDLDIDQEVVMDSDDEGIQKTVEFNLMSKLPFENTDIRLEKDQVVTEKRQLNPTTNQSYLGYFRRHSSKIQSCLNDHGNYSGANSIHIECGQKQHNVKGYEFGVGCQAAVCGIGKEGASDRSWDCDSNVATPSHDIRNRNRVSDTSMPDAQVEREVSISKYDVVDGRKDTLLVTDGHDHSTLSYIDSQEPGDASQANALCIVDRYLSVINVGLSPEVERGNTTRMMSPTAFYGKGSQALARKANQSTITGDIRIFDWSSHNETDDQEHFQVQDREKVVSGCKDHEQNSVSISQQFGELNSQRKKFFGEVALEGTRAHRDHEDSTQVALKSEEVSDMVQTAAMKSDINCIKKLDKQASLESFGQQMEKDVMEGDTSEITDVGLDTQMAAEAIEALMYAPPPNTNTSTPPPLENLLNGSSNCSSLLDNDSFKVIVKKRKRTMRSRAKLNRNKFSSSNIVAVENKSDHKLTVRKKLTSQAPPGKDKKIKKVCRDLSPSKSNCDSLLGKTQIGKCIGELKSCVPVDLRARQSSLVHIPLSIEGPPCYSGKREDCIVREVDCLKRGKKRSGLECGNYQVLDDRNKLPKIVSGAHCGATDSNSKQQMQTDPSLAATTSHLNFDFFSTYPKRKRTHVLHHLREASNHGASSRTVHGEDGRPQTVGIFQKSEANFSANQSILQAATKPRLDCQLLPLSIKKHEESFSRENTATSVLPAHRSAGIGKQFLKKPSLRSPLMKELSRLGFAESLPEFVSKDLRRRRKMANVQVLFSQSLNDHIKKQQIKILARLAISVASCCSEATHFVTDRFVRTRNMLEAIALGKPVVTHLWLENCAEAGCLVDEEKYILRDTNKEKEIGFDLSVSLARARHLPLLKDRRVYITPNVQPCKEMIVSLVKAVNGQPLEKIQIFASRDKLIVDDLLVLSCEEDYESCVPLLEEGVPIYNSELLLSGIVSQKLDYSRHQLFQNYIKNSCTKVYSRRAKMQR